MEKDREHPLAASHTTQQESWGLQGRFAVVPREPKRGDWGIREVPTPQHTSRIWTNTHRLAQSISLKRQNSFHLVGTETRSSAVTVEDSSRPGPHSLWGVCVCAEASKKGGRGEMQLSLFGGIEGPSSCPAVNTQHTQLPGTSQSGLIQPGRLRLSFRHKRFCFHNRF